jgi:hypothetical protein
LCGYEVALNEEGKDRLFELLSMKFDLFLVQKSFSLFFLTAAALMLLELFNPSIEFY